MQRSDDFEVRKNYQDSENGNAAETMNAAEIESKMAAMSVDERLEFYSKLFALYCQHCGSAEGYGCVCMRDD